MFVEEKLNNTFHIYFIYLSHCAKILIFLLVVVCKQNAL
jgi:hypothetical protein